MWRTISTRGVGVTAIFRSQVQPIRRSLQSLGKPHDSLNKHIVTKSMCNSIVIRSGTRTFSTSNKFDFLNLNNTKGGGQHGDSEAPTFDSIFQSDPDPKETAQMIQRGWENGDLEFSERVLKIYLKALSAAGLLDAVNVSALLQLLKDSEGSSLSGNNQQLLTAILQSSSSAGRDPSSPLVKQM